MEQPEKKQEARVDGDHGIALQMQESHRNNITIIQSPTAPPVVAPPPDADYDVCLSYCDKNKAQVLVFKEALEARKLRVWMDGGCIEDGLLQSRVFLAWYSKEYAQSTVHQRELTQALLAAPASPTARVLAYNPESHAAHITDTTVLGVQWMVPQRMERLLEIFRWHGILPALRYLLFKESLAPVRILAQHTEAALPAERNPLVNPDKLQRPRWLGAEDQSTPPLHRTLGSFMANTPCACQSGREKCVCPRQWRYGQIVAGGRIRPPLRCGVVGWGVLD